MPIMNAVLTGGTTSTSYLDSQVLTDLGSVIGQVATWIGNSTYLTIFFTLGLIGIGISLFHKMKNIVR